MQENQNKEQNKEDLTPEVGRSSKEKQLTRRLLLKSVALFGLIVLVLLSIATIIISHDATVDTESRLFREASRLRDVLVMTMLDEAAKKRERAGKYISNFAKDSLIHEVRVVSNDSVVVFSSETTEIGTKLDLLSNPLCFNCHNSEATSSSRVAEYRDSLGERHMHLVLPIKNDPACQKCHDDASANRATMIVDFSLSQLDESEAQTRLKLFGLLVILLLAFVVLIHALLTRVVYRPLVVIAERLEGIAKGYFGVHADLQLSARGNIMGHIHHHIDLAAHQLEASYERLEGEVMSRTKSLRESEDALSKERNKLQLILDGAPNCIIEISLDGKIAFANSRTEEIAGIGIDKVIDQDMIDFPLLKGIYESETVNRARETAELYRIERGTEAIDLGEAGKRQIDIRATRVETLEGPHALLIMLIDSTLEREVEAHLEQHERLAAVGQLAAGVAHEVGNPLSAISSIAQLMKQSLQSEDQKTHLDLIAYHIDRINRTVRDLSKFSRTPTDRLVKTSISSIIKAALEITKYDARASSVEFEAFFPETEREQTLPQDTLMQGFINVIMNGLDAVAEQKDPRITITVMQDDSETIIKIADNGPGIDESAKRRLVEPFYTTKSEGKGTGLGLFITHKIISGLGGTLNVESTLGEGATFIITIPEKTKVT